MLSSNLLKLSAWFIFSRDLLILLEVFLKGKSIYLDPSIFSKGLRRATPVCKLDPLRDPNWDDNPLLTVPILSVSVLFDF